MASAGTNPKVILITGCSSGLGLSLARAFLAHGHKVIATSRNPSRTSELVTEIEAKGGHWLPLDVASPTLTQDFRAALALHGHIDVLINNAGISRFAAFEDSSPSHAHQIFETNFFGALALTQLVLPVMRKQGSGTVVNISSGTVTLNLPGLSLYGASKWALEGWSEALAKEVAGLGIRVLLAVPGDMRTPFTSEDKAATRVTARSEAYREGAVEGVYAHLREHAGRESIDADRTAELIARAVEGKVESGLRVVIGSKTLGFMRGWANDFVGQVDRTEDVARTCDFPEGH